MNNVRKQIFLCQRTFYILLLQNIDKRRLDIETEKPHPERFIDKTIFQEIVEIGFVVNFLSLLKTLKPCSDERRNGFKSLKLKPCKFFQPSFYSM